MTRSGRRGAIETSPPAGKPRTERRNREAEVTDAAIQIFYAKGYPAASIQDVADKVGVLKGSLYHYISSKEDLLFSIISESHLQYEAIISGIEADGGSAMHRLERFLFDIMKWYLAHIERVSIFFNEGRHLTGDRLQVMKKNSRAVDSYVRQLISTAKSDGEIRSSIDPKLSSLFIMGALNSVATWYRKSGSLSRDTIATTYVEMMRAALVDPRAGGTPA